MTINIYLEPEETAALVSALQERREDVKELAQRISEALERKLREGSESE